MLYLNKYIKLLYTMLLFSSVSSFAQNNILPTLQTNAKKGVENGIENKKESNIKLIEKKDNSQSTIELPEKAIHINSFELYSTNESNKSKTSINDTMLLHKKILQKTDITNDTPDLKVIKVSSNTISLDK